MPKVSQLFSSSKPSSDFVPLAQLDDTESSEPCRQQKIPPVVFQTFVSRLVSVEHHQSVSVFRENNPDLAFRVFDDDAIDGYMEDIWGNHPIFDVYRQSLFPQMKSDIFRYCIVFDRGGYYIDINKAITEQITGLHDAQSAGVISFESNSSVMWPAGAVAKSIQHPDKVLLQWAFGFGQGHPILARTIDRIVGNSDWVRHRIFDSVRSAVVAFTGPGVFTAAVYDAVAAGEFDGVEQLGIDFGARGVIRVPGSRTTPLPGTHYSRVKNASILS